MVNDGDPNEPKATPDEMLSDEQRELRGKESVKPLPNGVWAEKLVDGQELVVGGSFIDSSAQIKLRLDFGEFEQNLANVTPENLRERYERVKDELQAWLQSTEQLTGRKIDIDPYLFYCLQQVQANVLAQLKHDPQNPGSGFERHKVYRRPNPRLSELVGKSHCAEIAALGQYMLQKADIESAYVGGTTMFDPNNQDEYAEPHSYIVIKDRDGHGSYIFDIARPGQNNLPTVLEPKIDFDYELLEGDSEILVESEEILLGNKRFFGVGEQVAGKHNVISKSPNL